MRAYRNLFLFWYAVSFILVFPLVRQFQNEGLFDSIGIWYSVYCAAGFALPVALILAAYTKQIMVGGSWWWIRR